jgi:hypothetical protein
VGRPWQNYVIRNHNSINSRCPHRYTAQEGQWRFLRNHADGIASIDLFVVPTISFRLLYALLVLRHSRRELVWLGVTAHPSAEWIARQLTEARGWNEPPRYIIRDCDSAYGEALTWRLRAMGIRDRPISARSGLAERLIGSIRRGCLDHVVIFGEQHLRHLLNSYREYYNESRTHLLLKKDACATSRAQDACWPCQSWVGFTIGTFEFEYPTGTSVSHWVIAPPRREQTSGSDAELPRFVFVCNDGREKFGRV